MSLHSPIEEKLFAAGWIRSRMGLWYQTPKHTGGGLLWDQAAARIGVSQEEIEAERAQRKAGKA